MKELTCATCPFYFGTDVAQGDCRRYPPETKPVPGSVQGNFITMATGYRIVRKEFAACAEHPQFDHKRKPD